MTQKHGLGRGLSSLIPQKNTKSPMSSNSDNQASTGKRVVKKIYSTDTTVSSNKHKANNDNDNLKRDFVKDVPIGQVQANTQQPRTYFDEEKMDELTRSIKTHGVLQPLIALKSGKRYELIAGERRLRASKKAGLTTVPVVVKDSADFDEQKKLELALIENVQRHDLNVIEEAKSYKKLSQEFDLSQEEIAHRTGKSRSVVANRMRLLELPIEIQRGLVGGKITEGHAKVILSLQNPQKQIALYNMIVDQRLTVRQAENKLSKTSSKNSVHRVEDTLHARRLEDQLTKYFNTKVRVKEKSDGGTISISYFSQEELKDILSRLKLS